MEKHILAHLEKCHNSTAFGALGIFFEKIDKEETKAFLDIDNRHLQPKGLVHGGIYVVLAESVASVAAMCTLKDNSQSVVAIEINANHIKSAKSGRLCAKATAIHLGQKTLIYETKVTLENKLISIGRCTLVVV